MKKSENPIDPSSFRSKTERYATSPEVDIQPSSFAHHLHEQSPFVHFYETLPKRPVRAISLSWPTNVLVSPSPWGK